MFRGTRGRWTAVFVVVGLIVVGGMTLRLYIAPAEASLQDPTPPLEGQKVETNLPVEKTQGDTDQIVENEGALPEEEAPQKPEEGVEEKKAESYDFSQPAPESASVELSYFDDAAFIGDSRTDGFLIYSGIGRGKNLTSNGLSIFKLDSKKALTINGEKYTLLEALAMEEYGKVYLSLGINELGYYDDQGFYESYCKAIDSIRAIQPNAVIYIQGLIPVNESVVAQTTGRTYLENDHLRVYNDLMKKAAEEKQVVFLDLYSEFANEEGELPAEASKDGVHLRSDWCKQWLTYLQTHTVDYDTLYPDGVPQVDMPTEGGGEDVTQ
ncbi:MAG: GDSL-type esterase/lipase family protein [Lawsonibacter sp.]|jgi:hypothetical protein